MPFINLGDMRKRITFQQPTEVKDNSGSQSQTYANISTNPTIWSKWVFDHGTELQQGGTVVSAERATVTIRYRSDVSTTWQVVEGSTNYWKIISPPENVQFQNRWTVFRVERVKGSL